jgi:predicted peptidase
MLPIIAAVAMQGPQLPADGANFTGKVTKTVSINYLITLPEDYATNNKKYPLILFLHGSGERGDDVNKVRAHGPIKEVGKGRKLPFIIISPQCPDRGWWDPDVLIGLLNKVEKDYRVDRKREYLTGLSMGGFGTWALAIAQPKRFAAIAPICGGGDPNSVGVLKDVPVWVTHGDADPAVPISQSQEMVDALTKAGGNVRFDIIKGGGHDVWTDVYASDAIYTWFLSHKR